MNTLKIATLYTRYSDVAQLLGTPTPEAHQELRNILLMSREDSVSQARYEVRVRHFISEGTNLEQRCPQRVFAWASAQFPATDHRQPEGESWSAMAADLSVPKGEFLLRFSSRADFATLLRGMQHYQRKLNRRTKKLLAQLRAYHTQQLAAEALRATMQAIAPTEPLLPTYGIPYTEYWCRIEAAQDLAEKKKQHNGQPNGAYGCEILWHPDFAVDCVRSFSGIPLHEVEPFFGGNLAQTLNVGRPLDRADYLYLADCLREGLADNPTPLAALRLARALAWVEQAGAALLPTAQPHLTAAQSEAAALAA